MFERPKIGLPVIEIRYLAKGNPLSFEEILSMVHNMLLYVLDELLVELEGWINRFVPKATGQLRESLIKNLKSSEVKKGLMRLVLGTHISYAQRVAEMSTAMVRHSGEERYVNYYGERGKIRLWDPEAIGNFFEEFVKFAEERTIFITQRAIDEYFKGTGKLMRAVRGKI